MNTFDERRELLRITYPFLWQRLDYLTTLVQETDPNILALVLYGSVARGTANAESDVDILIMVADERQFSQQSDRGVHLLVMTEDAVPWPSLDFAWAISPFVEPLDGRYMTEDLLANIQHDGILIFRRPGSALPAWMGQLPHYLQWKAQIARQLAAANVPENGATIAG